MTPDPASSQIGIATLALTPPLILPLVSELLPGFHLCRRRMEWLAHQEIAVNIIEAKGYLGFMGGSLPPGLLQHLRRGKPLGEGELLSH